jgi:hypothetical protein
VCSGVAGISMWRLTPNSDSQRVDDGVGHRRHGADAAGLARALDAERIGLGRHRVGLDLERRRGRRARGMA